MFDLSRKLHGEKISLCCSVLSTRAIYFSYLDSYRSRCVLVCACVIVCLCARPHACGRAQRHTITNMLRVRDCAIGQRTETDRACMQCMVGNAHAQSDGSFFKIIRTHTSPIGSSAIRTLPITDSEPYTMGSPFAKEFVGSQGVRGWS